MFEQRDDGGSRGARGDGLAPKHKWNIGYLLAAILGVLLAQQIWVQTQRIQQIPYSAFQRYLEEGRIESVEVGQETVRGVFTKPVDGHERFVTQRIGDELARELREAGVERYDGTLETTLFEQVLSWLIPIGFFLALWFFFFRRLAEKQGLGGGLMQVGKSKARVTYEERTGTRFDDVAGIDEAKEELQEIVQFLRDPSGYGRLGAHVPKGVLLCGPPGTGKTLVARAVAGEAAVPFFYINGSEFVEMFVGVGAARTRDLFRQARERAPAIIFIDELDALARVRSGGGAMGGGGHDEKEQTLNQLLVEMDGFDPAEGLVIIGATNRPEILDPALLRAGRFDRRVLVDRPDKPGRIAILKVHTKKVDLAGDVDLDEIAQLCAGFTGADLSNLVNEAALLATRREADAVYMQDFENAIERVIAGLQKKNRILSQEERTRVAYHELGHALVSMELPGTDPVQKVSIIPRSVGALGYTMQRPTGDRYLMTRQELQNKMCVLLGGRAAESLFFDDVSTGAQDDLQKVTDIARSMVAQYAMTDALGQLAYEREQQSAGGLPLAGQERRPYAEVTAREIDRTARQLVDEAFERTCGLIRARYDQLDRAARQLLEQETMDESELRGFFDIREKKTATGEARRRLGRRRDPAA